MFVGLVIGAIIAVIVIFVLALCRVAGDADEQAEAFQIVPPCYEPMSVEEIHPQDPPFTADITDDEIYMAAQTVWGEAHGVQSRMEQAAVVWCVLNRVDAWGDSLSKIVTAPHQFAYGPDNPTVDDFGRDLIELVMDVIGRWESEKCGEQNVGRVLPSQYLWFGGENGHNWFRDSYTSFDNIWDWSLPDPYETVVN